MRRASSCATRRAASHSWSRPLCRWSSPVSSMKERSLRMNGIFRDRDIISITDFSRSEILHLCDAGRRMEELEKSGRRNSLRDALKHRTLSYMFYEPSTRTRTSFNTGMRELGGRYDGFSGTEGTSVMKSETV